MPRPTAYLNNRVLREELGKAVGSKKAPGIKAAIPTGDIANEHRTNGGGVTTPKKPRLVKKGRSSGLFGRGTSSTEDKFGSSY
jgi:hypothetical protein